MIYIQGALANSFDAAGSPLEMEIFTQKMRSDTPFHYASKEALRFELRLRAAIVQASLDLEKSAAEFDTFDHSRCNERYWKRTEQGGFRLKSGVRPSEAVRDIYVNGRLYSFECATAIIIVLYKAVLDVAGDAVFDRLFDKLYLYSWHHDSDLQLITMYGKGEAFPGDVQYFENPDVDPKAMEWQGENVVVMPGGLYFGHGIGVTRGGTIIAKLNQHRLPGSDRSASLLDEATHPNFMALEEKLSFGRPMPRLLSEGLESAMAAEAFSYRLMARIGSRQYWHV